MEAKAKKTIKKGDGVYTEAIGRRKTSTARVRMTPSTKSSFLINDMDSKKYFPTLELSRIVEDVFTKTKVADKYEITAKVSGGGTHSQAEAIRMAMARILAIHEEGGDTELKDKLKKLGFLKRDPRAKERRKFGLKKARKAPQWSKR